MQYESLYKLRYKAPQDYDQSIMSAFAAGHHSSGLHDRGASGLYLPEHGDAAHDHPHSQGG